MGTLLELSNGNLLDPRMVRNITKFANKGVMLRNEFNKTLAYIEETDARRQKIIVDVLKRIIGSRNWVQPDWAEEFATAP